MGDFRIFTVGWQPEFAYRLLSPIADRTNIQFRHGIVGDSSRIDAVRIRFPNLDLVSISKRQNDPLPEPDSAFLASLEHKNIPSIRAMIRGDRVLRHRSEREALGYATLLARSLKQQLENSQPNLVLGTYDSIHAGLGLAVARSLKIPWVALAFPVIPDNLTGFSRGLTPDQLVPLVRPITEELRSEARLLINNVRNKQQPVTAYKAPISFIQLINKYWESGCNWINRMRNSEFMGIDQFTYPTALERFTDSTRRLHNRLRLPTGKMLTIPPKGRYIYFPMHMSPEAMLDTWAPAYQDQLGFMTRLSLVVPINIKIVIKLHFSDPDNYTQAELNTMMQIPNVEIAHPSASGNTFLEKASLVIGIQGTSCLEAALMAKSVLIFGNSPYQYFPATQRAGASYELAGQIRRLLNNEPPTDEAIVDAYAAYLAKYMPGRINDWSKPISASHFDRYAECFQALFRYLEDEKSKIDWYDSEK